MGLIACPDCSLQVSDRAPACPKCGAPVAAAQEVAATGVPLTTVQETAKGLKVHVLISAALFWGGVLWAVSAAPSDQASPLPGLLIFAGVVWYVVTRIRIWWHHK